MYINPPTLRCSACQSLKLKVESSESQILRCVDKQRKSSFFHLRLSRKVSPELSRQPSGATLKLQEN